MGVSLEPSVERGIDLTHGRVRRERQKCALRWAIPEDCLGGYTTSKCFPKIALRR